MYLPHFLKKIACPPLDANGYVLPSGVDFTNNFRRNFRPRFLHKLAFTKIGRKVPIEMHFGRKIRPEWINKIDSNYNSDDLLEDVFQLRLTNTRFI
jgi:hypothetical protein